MDSENAPIFSIKLVDAPSEIYDFLGIVKKEFNDFFGFVAREPNIFLINNRKEMDLAWGKKTEGWFVGGLKGGNIYIFDPGVFAVESTHKQEEFWQTLKHEYCHVYFVQITKNHFPRWINEGLACFLSGKKIAKIDDKQSLLNVFSYYDKDDSGVYSVSQYWVENLIKRFGKEKLVQLLVALKNETITEQVFASIFERIYGFVFDKANFSKLID